MNLDTLKEHVRNLPKTDFDQFKAWANANFVWNYPVPELDKLIFKVPPVVPKPTAEGAVFGFTYLSFTGTGLLIAAIISGLLMGFSPLKLVAEYGRTIRLCAISLITISAMLALRCATVYPPSRRLRKAKSPAPAAGSGAHREAAQDPSFRFKAADLGMGRSEKGLFDWWRVKSVEYGLGTLEDVVRGAMPAAGLPSAVAMIQPPASGWDSPYSQPSSPA